jgi:hypothetical protein
MKYFNLLSSELIRLTRAILSIRLVFSNIIH